MEVIPKIEISESNSNEFHFNSSVIHEEVQEISIEPKMEPEDENFFDSNPCDVKLEIKNKLISKMNRKRSKNEPNVLPGSQKRLNNSVCPTLVYTQYPLLNHYTPQYTSVHDLQNMAGTDRAKKSRVEFLNKLKEEQNRAIKEQEIQMRRRKNDDRRQKRREDREKRKNEIAEKMKHSEALPPQSKGLSYSDGTVRK